MNKFYLNELLIINEIFQVHCYIGETLDPVGENEATTCVSKELFISYALHEKPRKQFNNPSPFLGL